MSKHAAVKKGWILIPCDGEAHENPRIDNCGVCAPRWGEIEVHEASYKIGRRRSGAAGLLSVLKDVELVASVNGPAISDGSVLHEAIKRAIAHYEANHV